MKRIMIFLSACVLCSCTTKKQDQNVDVVQMLTQALDDSLKEDNKIMLCLFIMDKTCSACIEKEFLNIKSADIAVTLTGLFDNKRVFASSTTRASWGNVVFIQREEKHAKIVPRIFYFVYNPKEKTCSDIFYPDPCDEERTFSYFQKIKNNLFQEE